jgi:hypothetical protein
MPRVQVSQLALWFSAYLSAYDRDIGFILRFIFYSVHVKFVVDFLTVHPFYFSIAPSSQICFEDR